MRIFVKELTHLSRNFDMDFGWGDGYVCIPKGSKLYGVDYMEIMEMIPTLDVNGGLTFSRFAKDIEWKELPKKSKVNNDWIVGFDTAHYGDTLDYWTKGRVIQETENLREQLEDFDNKIY